MKSQPNPGKSLLITVHKSTYYRYPVRTNVVKKADAIVPTIVRYVKHQVKTGDIVVVSERIIAIMQGRSYPVTSIVPSWWARLLWRFVYKHPGGIGLRSPYTMELAIREVGLIRILFAAAVVVVTKPLGMRGMFYQVAGGNVNAIDGPTPYSLPPSDTSAKLAPKDPGGVAQQLEVALRVGVVIIDANDYGVNVLGTSDLADKAGLPIYKIFVDNPMGQAREQTPIMIVRKK